LSPLPDLHSFPTRRSSDLVSAATRRHYQSFIACSAAVFIGCANKPVGVTSIAYSAPSAMGRKLTRRCCASTSSEPHWQRCSHAQDRKSTRLNSSHVKISYA